MNGKRNGEGKEFKSGKEEAKDGGGDGEVAREARLLLQVWQ